MSMSKKNLFIISVIILIGIVLMWSCTEGVNMKKLHGDIAMLNPESLQKSDTKSGLLAVYNIQNKSFTTFGHECRGNPVFTEDKTKVLCKESGMGVFDYYLTEYDYLNDTYKHLYCTNRETKTYIGRPYYIPGKSETISFVEKGELYS